MKSSLLRSSALAAAVAVAPIAFAGAAFAAESPEMAIHGAVNAIAGHHDNRAMALITSASQAISTKNPASPAAVSLRYARQDLKAGHQDRAMQDLYSAEPLVSAQG